MDLINRRIGWNSKWSEKGVGYREEGREFNFYYVTVGRALHDRSTRGKSPPHSLPPRILIGLACSRQSENVSRLVTSQSRFTGGKAPGQTHEHISGISMPYSTIPHEERRIPVPMSRIKRQSGTNETAMNDAYLARPGLLPPLHLLCINARPRLRNYGLAPNFSTLHASRA